ncbi:MAG: hypothetical protein F6J93_00435 [Oscillatoria sp. SIO1A7]|nr:hypothetical protein [Oscillatoria sp. SIO1A7]
MNSRYRDRPSQFSEAKIIREHTRKLYDFNDTNALASQGFQACWGKASIWDSKKITLVRARD